MLNDNQKTVLKINPTAITAERAALIALSLEEYGSIQLARDENPEAADKAEEILDQLLDEIEFSFRKKNNTEQEGILVLHRIKTYSANPFDDALKTLGYGGPNDGDLLRRETTVTMDSLSRWFLSKSLPEVADKFTSCEASTEDDNPIKGLKLRTALNIILGMAKAKYDYDPERKRNPATGENRGSISADLQTQGINISGETISKYLRAE